MDKSYEHIHHHHHHHHHFIQRLPEMVNANRIIPIKQLTKTVNNKEDKEIPQISVFLPNGSQLNNSEDALYCYRSA